MRRIPEPELMNDKSSVDAYATADFSGPHENFLNLMEQKIGKPVQGETILELGCGSGDIISRFLRRYKSFEKIIGLDASDLMLKKSKELLNDSKVALLECYLPNIQPEIFADRLICNSVLHHLQEPGQLWSVLSKKQFAGSAFFLMDLTRPPDQETLNKLVELYAGNDPLIFKSDFANSLSAAYRPEEVFQQLEKHGLEKQITIETVSDRHMIAYGYLI